MSSYLEGLNAGREIVQMGVNAYTNARDYKNKLKMQDVEAAKTDFEQGRQTESDERAADASERADENADRLEEHSSKQDELIDAEIDSINSGHGRYGAGGLKNGRDYSAVDRNNLIHSLSSMKAMGATTPDQDKTLADLISIQGSASGASVPATPAEIPHPAVSWLDKVKAVVHGVTSPSKPGGGRTATGPKGEKITEPYPGAWGQ